MSLKPTKLIVCSDISDLQNRRRELVEKYEKTDKFVKWSDTAVELTNKLFIFKVVNVPTTVVDALRGYTEVELNHLTKQIDDFVNEMSEYGHFIQAITDKTSPEATGAPETNEKVEMGSDTQEEQKNDKNEG